MSEGPSNLLFSFVVPVYGTEAYLRRCLDSLAAQKGGGFEVVVVDDCSPGNCREIVASYDARFRYVRHDRNRSLFQARVTGMRRAAGRFVVALDSDDYVGDGLVQALHAEIAAHPDLDVVVYHMMLTDGTTARPAWHNQAAGGCSCREMLEKLFRGEAFWPVCGKAVRTEVYRRAVEALGVDDDFYLNSTEDLCQTVPILLTGGRASFIEYPGYFYYSNPASLSHSLNSPARIRKAAEQNHRSVGAVLKFLERRGAEAALLAKVAALEENTVSWLLRETEAGSDLEWSRCIDALVAGFGPRPVLAVLRRSHPDFLVRWTPSPGLFGKVDGRANPAVGVLCQRGRGGGAEVATQLWIRRMAAAGRKVVWFHDARWTDEVPGLGLPPGVETVPLEEGDLAARAAALAAAMDRHAVGTVALTDHWHELMFHDLLAVKSAGRRAVVADHSAYFFPLDDQQTRLHRIREKHYPLADVVTVLSPANVAWYRAAGIRNVVYMPNFLTFDVVPGAARRELPASGEVKLLVVGKLCERKNATALLEAFAFFQQRWNDAGRRCRLTFLGRFETPAYERTVRAALARLGLGDSVVLAGEHRDVASFFAKTTVMLMASRLEGAPMVLMEAKSHAVPTVMFALPYVAATEERDGVVSVPYGDTDALARALYDCVSDPGRYGRLSAAARTSLEAFGAEKILARWERVFAMLETGEVDPLCEVPSGDAMLGMTLEAVSRIVPVLDDGRAYLQRRIAQLESAPRAAADDGARRLAEAAAEGWRREAERLGGSRAFRIGRAVTWPYRMARGTLRSLCREGVVATVRRVFRKIGCLRRRFLGR